MRSKEENARINAFFRSMVKSLHEQQAKDPDVRIECPHRNDPRFVECPECLEELNAKHQDAAKNARQVGRARPSVSEGPRARGATNRAESSVTESTVERRAKKKRPWKAKKG